MPVAKVGGCEAGYVRVEGVGEVQMFGDEGLEVGC